MRVLVDTNILLRLAQPETEAAGFALDALDLLGKGGFRGCVVPQVIYEYWVVATRPLEQNGLDHRLSHVNRDLDRIQGMFLFLRDERAVFEHWHNLVSQHEVRGKNAHDARLVAAMHRHGVEHILTNNDRDFRRFTGITIHTPKKPS